MNIPDREEIQGELTGAAQELKAAQLLLDKGFYAQAVSSAYYAIFHAARAALWSKGIHAKTHRGLIAKLSEHFVASGDLPEAYFKIVTQSREQRELADYDIGSFDLDAKATEKLVSDAHQFVEKVSELFR